MTEERVVKKDEVSKKSESAAPSEIIEIKNIVDVSKPSPDNEPEPDLMLIGLSTVFDPNLEVYLYGKKSAGFPLLTAQPKPNMAMAALSTLLGNVHQLNSETTVTTNEFIIMKPAVAANNSLLEVMSSKAATFSNCTFNFGH